MKVRIIANHPASGQDDISVELIGQEFEIASKSVDYPGSVYVYASEHHGLIRLIRLIRLNPREFEIVKE